MKPLMSTVRSEMVDRTTYSSYCNMLTCIARPPNAFQASNAQQTLLERLQRSADSSQCWPGCCPGGGKHRTQAQQWSERASDGELELCRRMPWPASPSPARPPCCSASVYYITAPLAQAEAATAVRCKDCNDKVLQTQLVQLMRPMHTKAVQQVQRPGCHTPVSDKDDRPLPNPCCNEPVQQLAYCSMQGHGLCLKRQHQCHSMPHEHLAYTVSLQHTVNGNTHN